MDRYVIKTTRPGKKAASSSIKGSKRGYPSAHAAASTSTKVSKKGYPSAYAASKSVSAYETRRAVRDAERKACASSSGSAPAPGSGIAAIVKQWESAKRVMEAPDEPDIDVNDMEVHACAYKTDYFESINDKKRWVRNNCDWIKQLMKVIEEGVSVIDDPKPLDSMLMRLNMVKNDVQHIQKEFTPVSIEDLDKAMGSRGK